MTDWHAWSGRAGQEQPTYAFEGLVRSLLSMRGMSIPPRPAASRRLLRTLPWLAGLLLGTAAHLVWWTSMREPERVVQIHVNVPSPGLHVRVHRAAGDGVVHVQRSDVHARALARAKPRSCRPEARKARHPALDGARGAIVCSSHGCTIRRSFVARMLHDPSLLGASTRVQGVQGPAGARGLRVLGVVPGSVPALLGLRSGDVITELDGMTMRSSGDLANVAAMLEARDGLALTLQRGELRQTLRYRVIDG